MRRTLIFGMALLAGMMAARATVAAPQSSGSAILSGVVLGPDDKPVSHASVTYQSSSGNAPHAVFTDAKGRFAITKLHADNYDVHASAKGVFSEWQKNVALRTGQKRTITLRLIYAKEMPKAYGAAPAKKK